MHSLPFRKVCAINSKCTYKKNLFPIFQVCPKGQMVTGKDGSTYCASQEVAHCNQEACVIKYDDWQVVDCKMSEWTGWDACTNR